MAARASRAALAANEPEGRWASGPSNRSANTCSTTAWSRCWPSAWIISKGEAVNAAGHGYEDTRSPCPAGASPRRRKRRRAPGSVRVPAAQPGGGDHRRRQRRGNGGGQRVQPPHGQALAGDLGMTERRALPGVAVYPPPGGVDVDEGQHPRIAQQRRGRGQLRQQQPAHLLQLADVPEIERAQERPLWGSGTRPPVLTWASMRLARIRC